jgi:hypothetical protein
VQLELQLSAVLVIRCTNQMGWGICRLVKGECPSERQWRHSGHLTHRYCNMDYLLMSSLACTSVPRVIISYDIGCQWGINFHRRVSKMPDHLQVPLSQKKITPLVPKFHLEAHTVKCHARYSFNYAVGVGRTDGEGVERNWSLLNSIASSVSMMGPGGRWDTMDDFCNFANWRKTVGLRA